MIYDTAAGGRVGREMTLGGMGDAGFDSSRIELVCFWNLLY